MRLHKITVLSVEKKFFTLLAALFVLVVLSVKAQAHQGRTGHSHGYEHDERATGQGLTPSATQTVPSTMVVTMTPKGLHVHWAVSAWELIGFYGPLDTPVRQERWDQTIHWLLNPESLWLINQSARCRAGRPVLRSPQGFMDAQHGWIVSGLFYLDVDYTCDAPPNLQSMNVSAFLLFPSLSSIGVRLVNEGAALSGAQLGQPFELNPATVSLPLKTPFDLD